MALQLDIPVLKLLKKYQRMELTTGLLYDLIARRERDAGNREALSRIAESEREHAAIWAKYTGTPATPDMFKVRFYDLLSRLLGYTFVIKLLEDGEYRDIAAYGNLKGIAEQERIISDEKKHETKLHDLLDEERLKYVGDVVLGLNDALVELTGTLAGLTFALASTKLVALAGIITGAAATLSMAASNYLAERAEDNPHALKASCYTGAAYLFTVVLLVLPYLLFPEQMYAPALWTMLGTAIIIILLFNCYISIAKSRSILKSFGSMTAISMGVALVSFLIGLAAKQLLGVDM